MDKNQLILSICLVTMLMLILTGFLLFIVLMQRRKSNRFIKEREKMKVLFNEQLLKAQLEIQEQTFKSISMEIHDNVGQTLSLLSVQLNIMDHAMIYNRTPTENAKMSVQKAMTDLRDIAKSLDSDRLSELALPEIAEDEIRRVCPPGLIKFELQITGEEQLISAEKKLIIFRMIQESIQNVIKHAEASFLSVSFSYLAGHLEVLIADNGKGFNTTAIGERKGLGLQNMLKRTKLIGGEVTIDSAPGHGTNIKINSPYV